MSILMHRLQKHGRLLGKILAILLAIAIPILLLLQRMDFVRLGFPRPVTFKAYETLQTTKEKARRGEVWFKIWSYNNALWVYTDVLFGESPKKMSRHDWGRMPIKEPELKKVDLMLYRVAVCLSQLNKRREGIHICEQFEARFPDSKYLKDVQKLRKELVARRLPG